MLERDFLLSSHFTDKASHEVCTGTDKFNVRQFGEAVMIDCRKVEKTTVIKSAMDESIISSTSIYTFDKVEDLDKIDGRDVLAIVEWKSLLTNSVVGYIVRI